MKLAIPPSQQTRITLAALPDGVEGIKVTLDLMVKLAQKSKQDFNIRNQALRLVENLPSKDFLSEVSAIHAFVRDSIRYVKDIRGVETLATPIQTLRMMQGDCDDKALLASALLEAIGHPTRFVAVGSSPDEFDHVLIETRVANKWIPVETTEPVPVGWYPPGVTQRLVRHV